MGQYVIGVDVGGTKTAYGVLDPSGAVIARRRAPSDSSLGPEAFFGGIADSVNDLMRECSLSREDLAGIGVGVPSYVRFEDGYILKTANLTKIRDFYARTFLSERLGFPVALDNDARTAALAESRRGAGRGFANMLYCPLSTGISSAVVIGGKLFRGSYGWSGETGHSIITPGQGLLCGCGNRGCFMSWCSGSMIVRHIRSWIEEGGTTLMTQLAGGADNITTLHLSQAWEAGDAMAVRAVDQMAHYLGVWTFNLYVTFNINCFVFGGGLLAMGDKLMGKMRENFDRYNQDEAHPVYFREAELGGDMGVIGAAELIRQRG